MSSAVYATHGGRPVALNTLVELDEHRLGGMSVKYVLK